MGAGKPVSPDAICRKYGSSRRRTRIAISELDDDTILIEAPAHGLRFLAEVLAAQAEFSDDCGFQMGPRDAGSWFFERSSQKGLYIHRLPCLEEHRTKRAKRSTGKRKKS